MGFPEDRETQTGGAVVDLSLPKNPSGADARGILGKLRSSWRDRRVKVGVCLAAVLAVAGWLNVFPDR